MYKTNQPFGNSDQAPQPVEDPQPANTQQSDAEQHSLEDFGAWMDAQLLELQSQHTQFVTPNSTRLFFKR